jgi:benzoyl-CoA reductase subunit C
VELRLVPAVDPVEHAEQTVGYALELGLRGNLDVLDGMLFPSVCDVIRNLSGIWKLLFPERYASYVDLPQRFEPELGGRFYTQEMLRIAGELADRGAKPLCDDALRAAIAQENERRAALATLDELRRAEPWRLSASDAYLAVRAGAVLPTAEHTTLLEEFRSAVLRRPARFYDNVRVIVEGAFCEQPSLALIRTLENAGCFVVEDDFQLGVHTIQGSIGIDSGEEPLVALARAFLERGAANATRYIDEEKKGAHLVRRVRAARADGVVFVAASFCDPALLDQPMLETALDEAGISHTSFKFSENMGQFQVIREQAGAFSDSVKLWGKTA